MNQFYHQHFGFRIVMVVFFGAMLSCNPKRQPNNPSRSLNAEDDQNQRGSQTECQDSTTIMECFLSIRKRQTPSDFADENPRPSPSFLLFADARKLRNPCDLSFQKTLGEIPIQQACERLAKNCNLRLTKTKDGYIFDTFIDRQTNNRLLLEEKTIRELSHIQVPIFDWESSKFDEIVEYLMEILERSNYHLKSQLEILPSTKIVARGDGHSMLITLKYVAIAFDLRIVQHNRTILLVDAPSDTP